MNLEYLNEGKFWKFKDKIILTDLPYAERVDAVFHLCHENTFFCQNLNVKKGDKVLDLCTGSGILALFAADKASKVIATDISPRAIAFSKINIELNNLSDKIEVRQGNLFEPVKNEKFDLIITNPPFEPTPEGSIDYLYSDGGEKGTKFIELILLNIREYLNQNGRFQMIAYIPDSQVRQIKSLLNITFKNIKIKHLTASSPHESLLLEPMHYIFINANMLS
jgi:release factor glutamine methyltransferase